MFYRNSLKIKKSKEKEFEFDLFAENINLHKDESLKQVGSASNVYNLITSDGSLRSGYGFKIFEMPKSTDMNEPDSLVVTRGEYIRGIWKLKWYNRLNDDEHYYLFYFTENGTVYYDNLFSNRLAPFQIPTDYTELPFTTFYRFDGEDALLMSGSNGKMMTIYDGAPHTKENCPQIISCCSHYGMLFAITADSRGKLIYSEELNILNWTDEKTKNLDFADERGDLVKLVPYNDDVYIFRDYGISKISVYSSNDEFSTSHIYLADNYIYPNSIAQSGDNIYFMEASGLKVFNGSSIKSIKLDCIPLLSPDNRNCYATCYKGKYYLACRGDFKDGKQVGCESLEEGYKNNMLLVVDLETLHVDITRGVDIFQVLALVNPYKSKLVACFNSQFKNKIGELTEDGSLFENNETSCFECGTTDFGMHGKIKRLKSFLIRTLYDCTVEIESEKGKKIINVKGKNDVQKIKASLIGNRFKISFKASGKVKIDNFVVKLGIPS